MLNQNISNLPFIIDSEFENLLPKLDTETFNLLESQIVSDSGCRDALVVWQEEGILVDGHNRFRICEKHGIPLPKFIEMSFENREAVRYWILVTQDSRRRYTNEQQDYYRGMRYAMEKSGHGGDRKSSGKSCNLKTHEKIAAECGVSPRTIINNEKYYEMIEALGEVSPQAKEIILSGNSGTKRKEIIALNGQSEEKLRNFALSVIDGLL